MTANAQKTALAEFDRLLEGDSFPCFMGLTAHRRGQVFHVFAGAMACPADDARLARDIAAFANAQKPEDTFHSLVVHFVDGTPMAEEAFEKLLFRRLQGIHDIDRGEHDWDPAVSDDPDDPAFSMSIGGKGFYVVGLHPGASRPGRRLAHAALVFNLHAQFEFLRQEGRYDRLKSAIIDQDIERNGSSNPMLAVHGSTSEARQYSGRNNTGEWQCPFAPRSMSPMRKTA